jgi:Uma2 family endonuclease
MDMNAYISRESFRDWVEQQPRGRFERVDGRVVPMTAERAGHALIKSAVWEALRNAIRHAGIEAQAFPDGMTVEVGEHTDYEPDALVNLGPPIDLDDVAAPCPVVVVEVLSPGMRSIDTGDKLAGYFRVRSIVHYLVVSARRRQVVHHRRSGDTIVSAVVTEGDIALDPPGIAIGMNDIYRDLPLA